jgi:hypothetical protein
MENERTVVVVDEGQKVLITHGPKRQRVLFLDGEERELDDGDGPAKVRARRKGNRISFSMKWSSERQLSETWDLLAGPRRVVVTTKGREAFTYRRVYEPAPDLPPEPTLTPSAAAAPPAPAATQASIAGPAPAPAGMAECSVRPPRGTRTEEYSRLARITQRDAQARAMAAVAPARPTSTITSDAEVYDGCLVWTFDFRFEGKPGVQEVVIDAGDGKLLKSTFEGPN